MGDTCLAKLVEHATPSRGCKFKPHLACRDYFKKKKGIKKAAIVCDMRRERPRTAHYG